MNSGIYIIRNTLNGKVYVGSSKNFVHRFRAHKAALRSGKHHSKKLQRSWTKHGERAFSFEKVLVCSVENLLGYEQIVIDYYAACSTGYNILPKAGSREGAEVSSETIAKLKVSQRMRRKKYAWKGQQLCLAEIAEMEGVSHKPLERRVNEAGWSLIDAVAEPVEGRNQPLYGFGESLTINQWIERIGCSSAYFRNAIARGLTVEQCVEKYKRITVGEFATVSGIDTNTFSQRIRLGWSIGDALGTPVKKAFSIEDARAIRELAKTTPTKAIANSYGVHRDTIGLIVRNISFKEAA